eukprot:6205343-Pleurochrysis_carterae.AAC.4
MNGSSEALQHLAPLSSFRTLNSPLLWTRPAPVHVLRLASSLRRLLFYSWKGMEGGGIQNL